MHIVYRVRKLPSETVNLADCKFTDARVAVLSFSSSDDKNSLKIILPRFMQHKMQKYYRGTPEF